MKHLLSTLLLLATACSAGSDGSTGSSCPTASAPTYAGFGQRFFARYCTGCHSALAADRHGAPKTENFDSEAEIRLHAAEIDLDAAAGPDARNTDMPDMGGPVKDAPSDAERAQLGQFLACERSAP